MSERQRTISLTDRQPIQIRESEWPVLARASDVRQSTEPALHALYVRRHSTTAAALVYAVRQHLTVGRASTRRRGELLEAGADIVAAVHRVAVDCEIPPEITQRCLASLPPERVSSTD